MNHHYDLLLLGAGHAHLGVLPLLGSGGMDGYPLRDAGVMWLVDRTAHASMQMLRGLLAQFGRVRRVDTADEDGLAEALVLCDRERLTPVLLVDDLADSGVTLTKVMQHLKDNFDGVTEVKSAVIWTKGSSAFRPDYQMEELPHNPWIHQPFEDYDALRPHQLAAW